MEGPKIGNLPSKSGELAGLRIHFEEKSTAGAVVAVGSIGSLSIGIYCCNVGLVDCAFCRSY
jgi:hypothetical protein